MTTIRGNGNDATSNTTETAKAPAQVSRRLVLGGAAAAGLGAVCVFAAGGRARAAGKATQADASYQDSPKDGAKCDGCAQFQAPSACAVVDGTISPNGWCQLYSPKA